MGRAAGAPTSGDATRVQAGVYPPPGGHGASSPALGGGDAESRIRGPRNPSYRWSSLVVTRNLRIDNSFKIGYFTIKIVRGQKKGQTSKRKNRPKEIADDSNLNVYEYEYVLLLMYQFLNELICLTFGNIQVGIVLVGEVRLQGTDGGLLVSIADGN